MKNPRYIIGIDPGDENNLGAVCIMDRLNGEIASSYNIKYKDFEKEVTRLQLLYEDSYIIKEGEEEEYKQLTKKIHYPGVDYTAFTISLSKMDMSQFYDETLMQEMIDFANNYKPKSKKL